jgi:cystathionine beta-lyase/cystathionine gamma-synthase
MNKTKILNYIKKLIENVPADWLALTTHRLDIYNEKLAKTEFLEQFEILFKNKNTKTNALSELPTAYDYIRLGHPLSSVLEWAIAKLNYIKPKNVVSFSSRSMPVLAVLRKNLFEGKNTQIIYSGELPAFFDVDVLHRVYGYKFSLEKVEKPEDASEFNGSTIYITSQVDIGYVKLTSQIDFFISTHEHLGSVLVVNGEQNESYIREIQHVRRRETIAMTPANCFTALKQLIGINAVDYSDSNTEENKKMVVDEIKENTHTDIKALIGSSGLSIQYAIMMGLIDYATENHKGRDIKIVVPPNCYGGTNDQARRVAACLDNVEVLDLPVDREHDMVESTDMVLEAVARQDAIPLIIAEIPTNPRVEVPDLTKLKDVLSKVRKTTTGKNAIGPVFILDQTFCPNVNFLREDQILSAVSAIAYVSGSKFPSGGKCTAGYCVTNKKGEALLEKIEMHLKLCDNEATDLQLEILAQQLPSMNKRIEEAYKNTREFVNFIKQTLPAAKINFVSEELSNKGFTPSVFSLDLPAKGETEEEREHYKRALNHKLINLMINKIPNGSKYCVSYGQLKGCYWTIPATSTQGTTKEADKDYIVRASLSPDMDMELHKKVFIDFVKDI